MLSATYKKAYISFVVIAILTLAVWTTLSYHSHDTSIIQHDALPDAFMEDVTATVMDKQGKPRLIIKTPKMIYYIEKNTSELINPELTIYRNSSQPWYITSKYALATQGTEQIDFKDDVEIHHAADHASPATVVKTPSLRVYPNQQTAETKDAITLIQPNIIVNATGMLANLTNGDIKLLSQARGEYVPD